ncbi:hypothetical protein A3J19_00170 [Candidatus Daviesbacteria bacterium RIFCSPLOWO2_02_FULL_41_8]|uniref:DUF5615 domain-containing protein n=3 Tax=Candidatus Daviesiibacteriota TaxID=1752718 RepID=A0A1F5NM57_9BACT|nr:MAG: hypothetical protein A2871_01385 [Candidatus Daviesbacteria bacterium RIFCSPHIGHO2_01_FULL_41_23]OGE32779.1 MAG: hypothetical protein A3D83_03050 [Candidatus Daviesbacteria bacterium RIFCSPHIGHO2_02_FULL_41_10]OGE62121.1 MAG: hypothetical protein A2967_00480 [Candidatus Daviesbacteria bacterium RIFCSPLOWO2_01_FULL_41_32]OGE78602.1 MAG: hypothetical protein A3J19_00170 [Candidatus Daviesbacteria bacterium RIFCSPLOWO2_02_FULL_41_8]
MRFLADEDFPKPLVVKIRSAGYSVKTIQQKALQGSSDEIVANLALKEKRILLTFDKDFFKNQTANLQVIIFSFPKTPTSEIILLTPNFLKELKQFKLSKGKVLKFCKSGLEEQK